MNDEPPVTPPLAADSMEDFWTCRGDLWTRTMPARTIDEFASGDVPELMVMRQSGGSVVVFDAVSGERSSEQSLEAAKAVADEMARRILSTRNADMLAQSGLDPEEWKFCWQDRFLWFGSRKDADQRIERHGPRQWVAMDGRRSLGIAPTPSAAASIFERTAGPRAPGAPK